MTTSWQWRQESHTPSKVLVVVACTKYTPHGFEEIEEMLLPAYYRMLGDPRCHGLAARLNRQRHAVWSQSAWSDYDALEGFVYDQIDWLKSATIRVKHDIITRHNAYRIVPSGELPFSWTKVEKMLDEVRRISPMGADAFPELSKALDMEMS